MAVIANIRRYSAVMLLAAALCGCSSVQTEEVSSKTSALPESTLSQTNVPTAVSAETESSSETTSETETIEKSTEQLALEEKIIEAAGLEAEFVYPAFSDDFDGDGAGELFAVCGTGGTFGSLWYAGTDGAEEIYPAQTEWGEFRTAEVGGDTLILTERLSATDSVTYCFRIENGDPIGIDTFNAGSLTQTDGAEFTGIKSTYDFCTDGTGHTWKPYWFYYANGEFREHLGHSILYENFKDNFGGVSEEFAYLQPYFDETEAENGKITNVIVRDNGIVNINYKIVEDGKEFLAYRYFRTLLVNDGTVTDITPEDNFGNYEDSINGSLLDYRIY